MTDVLDALALARSGFRDGERAAVLLADVPGIPAELRDRVARAADPDLALENLVALAASAGGTTVWKPSALGELF